MKCSLFFVGVVVLLLTYNNAAQLLAIEEPTPTEVGKALNTIHVREGFEVQLVAAEPLVMDPVAIDWGPDGKLWVVEMADYPLGADGKGKPGGRVRFLEDTDDDGQYDKSTLFAEGLSFPNGVLAWGRGILVTAAPQIVYLEDSTGNGKADVRNVLCSGFLEGNQQLRVNGLRWGLDNWVYCASGSHHAGYGKDSRITSHVTGQKHQIGSRDFRVRPHTGAIDRKVDRRNTEEAVTTGATGSVFRTAIRCGITFWPIKTFAATRTSLRLIPSIRSSRRRTRQSIQPANCKNAITVSVSRAGLLRPARR